jgi:hypothetical protein
VLGSLVALYEHSVFTQGCIWGIEARLHHVVQGPDDPSCRETA